MLATATGEWKTPCHDAIYDALHLVCAERHRCGRVYTFNTTDFERLKTGSILIVTP